MWSVGIPDEEEQNMSFSSDVKKELSRVDSLDRYDRVAEIAALIAFGGKIYMKPGEIPAFLFHSENPVTVERFIRLAQDYGISPVGTGTSKAYAGETDAAGRSLLRQCGFIDNLGRIVDEEEFFENALLQKNSCQRAFLRGAFLASGSITDPNKNYHFEISCSREITAFMLQRQMEFFGLEARLVRRKKSFIVYMKEGAMISEILAVMGAGISKLNFENIRIYKDVRNVVNRRVNCETANLGKTVSAAVKQIEDIEYIKKAIGFRRLPEPLRVVACARLEDSSATLKELGERLEPPLGKSGVNHRLRKLSRIAEELREKNHREINGRSL